MSRLRLQIYPTMPCAEYFGLEVRVFKVRSAADALLHQRSSAEPSEGVVWDQTTVKGLARFFNPSNFSYYSENMRHLSPCLQTQHRRFPSSKHISSHVWIRTKESIKFFISGTDARGNTSRRLFLKGYFSAYLNLVTQLPHTSIPTGHWNTNFPQGAITQSTTSVVLFYYSVDYKFKIALASWIPSKEVYRPRGEKSAVLPHKGENRTQYWSLWEDEEESRDSGNHTVWSCS